jgi:hypothetical protein
MGEHFGARRQCWHDGWIEFRSLLGEKQGLIWDGCSGFICLWCKIVFPAALSTQPGSVSMLQAFPGVGISWSVSNVIDEAVGKLEGICGESSGRTLEVPGYSSLSF